MYYGEVRIPNSDLEPLLRTATSLKIKGLSTHYRSETTSATQPEFSKTTPLKKRRISSSDVDEERHRSPSGGATVQETPNPALAPTFSYDDNSHLRILTQSSLSLQQGRTLFPTADSGRISPVRVQSPTRMLQESRKYQTLAVARHQVRGKKGKQATRVHNIVKVKIQFSFVISVTKVVLFQLLFSFFFFFFEGRKEIQCFLAVIELIVKKYFGNIF
jgi:hypothetical protein